MSNPPNDDVDFIVRIKGITNPTQPNAAIVVRPNVIGDGSVTVGGVTGDPQGTDVKFKLNAAMQLKYKFDTYPICVYDSGAGQTNCPGGSTAATFPPGWQIACKDPSPAPCLPDANNRKVVLHIPVLSPGANFKYKLFLVDTSVTPNAKVVIDPRIGCCQIDQSVIQRFIDKTGLTVDQGVSVILLVAALLGFFTAKKLYFKKTVK